MTLDYCAIHCYYALEFARLPRDRNTMPAHLLKRERQLKISQFVREHSQATVGELGEHFGVSQATVRRDLEELALDGTLLRTHGGALYGDQSLATPPVHQRAFENAEIKRCIGAAAAELIADDETIFIGSGSTTFEVARALRDKRRITVITNALNIANELAGDPNITLIVLGGLLRPGELSMIGHLTEQALREVRADKVIIGINAIHAQHGLTNEYLQETITDREIIRSGSQVIVVADHTKFDKICTAFVAPLQAIHKIVTDRETPPQLITALRQVGILVDVV